MNIQNKSYNIKFFYNILFQKTKSTPHPIPGVSQSFLSGDQIYNNHVCFYFLCFGGFRVFWGVCSTPGASQSSLPGDKIIEKKCLV